MGPCFAQKHCASSGLGREGKRGGKRRIGRAGDRQFLRAAAKKITWG